jgi:hypothetical protein
VATVDPVKAARRKIRIWRKDGVQFVRENFGIEPDFWQKEALEAFCAGDVARLRISLQACAGPGKTALLAWLIWLFMSCFGDELEHPKGAAVSVSSDNLKTGLWAELAKWQDQSEFLKTCFTWTAERVFANDHPKTWFMAARAWSKDASPEEQGKALSGIHSKYVLFIIDESGTIPVSVLKKAEQALSTSSLVFGRIVQAGNPTSRDGMLYAAATELAHLWKVIRITGDPDDPRRSPRIDIEWAREMIRTHGRTDPWLMGHVLGEFPPGGLNTLLGPDEVEKAMARVLRPEDYQHIQKRLGIDVGAGGMDPTVLAPRQGLQAFNMVEMRNARGPAIAGRVVEARSKWGQEIEFVDGGGGFGNAVEDALILTGRAPIMVYGSGKANDPRYFNKRAECYWELKLWVERGGSLPNDPRLKRELTTVQYYLKDGKLKIEDKEQLKKRMNGLSPDRADALANTFFMQDCPATLMIPGISAQLPQARTDFDPLNSLPHSQIGGGPVHAKKDWDPLGD